MFVFGVTLYSWGHEEEWNRELQNTLTSSVHAVAAASSKRGGGKIGDFPIFRKCCCEFWI